MLKLDKLKQCVTECRQCPRLVQYRESVKPKPPYLLDNYWKKPVPGFGDPNAWLLLTGLAPASHGGNRTGRLFTGDLSSRFLMRNLFAAGLANQPTSESSNDGLILIGCYMTAVVKCSPPKDKPLASELHRCIPYYAEELHLLKQATHILALGRTAFQGIMIAFEQIFQKKPKWQFRHGGRFALEGCPTVYASYHPSPQNTNTGKLTDTMFLELIKTIQAEKF